MLAATGVALVTGASRGIGAAVAKAAANLGYDVAVNYRARADKARGGRRCDHPYRPARRRNPGRRIEGRRRRPALPAGRRPPRTSDRTGQQRGRDAPGVPRRRDASGGSRCAVAHERHERVHLRAGGCPAHVHAAWRPRWRHRQRFVACGSPRGTGAAFPLCRQQSGPEWLHGRSCQRSRARRNSRHGGVSGRDRHRLSCALRRGRADRPPWRDRPDRTRGERGRCRKHDRFPSIGSSVVSHRYLRRDRRRSYLVH